MTEKDRLSHGLNKESLFGGSFYVLCIDNGLCYNNDMDWNDDTNKVTVGVGILIAIALVYAMYRVVARRSRGSGMYRTDAQENRNAIIRTILMLILAMLTMGGILWLLSAF